MSAWDHKGRYVRDDDEGRDSHPSRSVLNRWRLLNLMRPPGLTDSYFRILSLIAQLVPPGNLLIKGSRQLAEGSGVSERNVKRFFPWAYKTGLMCRSEDRLPGLAFKKWPDYLAWLDYAVATVARMEEGKGRDELVRHLAEFGVCLHDRLGDSGEAWGKRFKASIRTSDRPSPTSDRPSLPPVTNRHRTSDRLAPPPVTGRPPRTKKELNPKQKHGTEREDGPELEPAPLRTSRPSSLPHQDPEEPKTTARANGKSTKASQKRAHEVSLFFEVEAAMAFGSLYRRWDKAELLLASNGQFQQSLAFARDVHRECFDPIMVMEGRS